MAGKSEPVDTDSLSEKDVKAPNLLERAKEEVEAVFHKKSPHPHHKETHGHSDDIDENTPIDEIKAPGVFERAKEEVEALVEAIHPKKESESHDSPSKKKNGGAFASIGKRFEKSGDVFASMGKRFEKVCSPGSKNNKE